MRVLLAALALLALTAAPARAAEIPEGYAYTDEWFESFDGTQMHAGVFLPADHKPGERHPVILTLTPYAAPNGGASAAAGSSEPANTSGPVIRFPELFTDAKILENRWAYVQVDVRGFGGSGGCFEYYGPNEAKDAGAVIEWAADREWSTGKVATWGKSYDAATGVLALAARPKKGLAAAVIQAPGLSGYTGLWYNRVHYATARYGTTGVYTADDLGPPHNPGTLGSPEYAFAFADGLAQPPNCRSDALVGMNTERNRDSAFWQAREPYLQAKGSTVPVLWTHGFFDANTKPVHLDVWGELKGPHHAWFGQWDHIRGHEGGVGRAGFLEQAMRFLDEHVRGVKPAVADPPVTIQRGDGDGLWRAEELWPPADAQPWSMPLRPGEYVDGPGNVGDGPSAGNGHWTVSEPLPHDAHLAGEARVKAAIDAAAPDVNVVAHLYDIDPEGTATLVNRGAMAAPGTGAREVEFAVYPQDWVFAGGHRIGLLLSGSDDDWFSPGVSQSTVAVTGGTLTLPLLRYRREATLEGDKSVSMTRARPFPVGADVLAAAQVASGAPPAQVAFPKPAARPTRLKLRITGRRRLIVTGRTKRGVRSVRLVVRFGGVRVVARSVRVRRTGAFRARFSLKRLRAGRLTVTARPRGGGTPLRGSIRLRAARRQ
jgi:predicted acyl esterase